MESRDARGALGALVSENGVSYAALSRMLGRNPAYVQQYVMRGSPRVLGEDDRRLLAAFFRVDEVLLGAPVSRAASPTIRRLDLAASAGPGGIAEDERAVGAMVVDPAVLAGFGLDPSDAAILPAAGDSMTPTIEDGDMMLVDQRDRAPGVRGAIYVVRLDGVLLVKRVARDRAGTLSIASDNPAYPTVSGDVGCEVIGRVVWLSRALR